MNAEEIPDFVDDQTLADFSDQSERQIRQLATEGVVVRGGKKGVYEFRKSIRGMFQHLRSQLHGAPAERAANRARRDKAEAESAEFSADRMAGKLCERVDYIENYRDAIAQGVRNISRLTCLTTEQKEAVLAAIRDVKLAALPEENG